MRLCERRCEVCGHHADGDTSAHFARVVWLCREHSADFHQPHAWERFRRAPTTLEAWRLIDRWLNFRRAELEAAKMGQRLWQIVEMGGGV